MTQSGDPDNKMSSDALRDRDGEELSDLTLAELDSDATHEASRLYDLRMAILMTAADRLTEAKERERAAQAQGEREVYLAHDVNVAPLPVTTVSYVLRSRQPSQGRGYTYLVMHLPALHEKVVPITADQTSVPQVAWVRVLDGRGNDDYYSVTAERVDVYDPLDDEVPHDLSEVEERELAETASHHPSTGVRLHSESAMNEDDTAKPVRQVPTEEERLGWLHDWVSSFELVSEAELREQHLL